MKYDKIGQGIKSVGITNFIYDFDPCFITKIPKVSNQVRGCKVLSQLLKYYLGWNNGYKIYRYEDSQSLDL